MELLILVVILTALGILFRNGFLPWRRTRNRFGAITILKMGIPVLIFGLFICFSILFLSPASGPPPRLSVNIDELRQTVVTSTRLSCAELPWGGRYCITVPITESVTIPDCTDLGALDGCINRQAILSTLQAASYAFNSPNEMFLELSETIALVIDSSGTADFDQELRGLPGAVVQGGTPITLQMEAELVGPAFDIKPAGRQRRKLSTLNPTRWDWEVTPLREGEHQLEVSLYVILTKSGEKISEDKSLAQRRLIQVSVSNLDRALALVRKIEPLQAFVFAILAGLAALLAWFGYRKWRDFSGEPDEEKPQKIEVSIKNPENRDAPHDSARDLEQKR